MPCDSETLVSIQQSFHKGPGGFINSAWPSGSGARSAWTDAFYRVLLLWRSQTDPLIIYDFVGDIKWPFRAPHIGPTGTLCFQHRGQRRELRPDPHEPPLDS